MPARSSDYYYVVVLHLSREAKPLAHPGGLPPQPSAFTPKFSSSFPLGGEIRAVAFQVSGPSWPAYRLSSIRGCGGAVLAH